MLQRLIHIILLFFAGLANAAVVFHAVADQDEVEANQPFSITFMVVADTPINISKLELPSFRDCTIISEGNVESQTIINGAKQIQVGKQVVLLASKTGALNIEKAKAIVNGKEYYSDAVSVKIIKGSSNLANAPQIRQKGEPILNVEFDKKEYFAGEAFTATIRLYTPDPWLLNKMSSIKKSGDFPQGVNIEFEENDRFDSKVKQKKIGDKTYYIADVRKFKITSNTPATIDIPSFILGLSIGDGFFDDREAYVESSQVRVHIKNRPATPKGFSGFIGHTPKLNVSIDKPVEEVYQNKAVNLTISLSGSGSNQTVLLPKVHTSQGVEVYPSKLSREGGQLTETIMIVPTQEGEQKIKIEPFIYFDTQKGKYETVYVDDVILDVKKQDSSLEQETPQNIESEQQSSISTDVEKIEDVNNKGKGSNILLYGLALAGVAGGASYLLRRRKSNKKEKQVEVNRTPMSTISKEDICIYFDTALLSNLSNDELYATIEKELDDKLIRLSRKEAKALLLDEQYDILKASIGVEKALAWKDIKQKIQGYRYSPVEISSQQREELITKTKGFFC